ncbi:protein EARLY HEADING DATE 2-like [Oryza brachyantha]|uniref:protein EARLY HEADING DATE 2-like n=1 Tax=Oryza brachyantha TaxID=4533 RepID=UPI001ADA335C|nr:protein EARLY HEADING DATE 2-like [Oryza brachyantha]
MLLSDLSSDQEATGSNSHGAGGGDMGGVHGHVVLSSLFLPAPAAMLLPPALVVEEPKAKKKRSLPGNPDPEAEVIALSPRALVATNRFVCEVCNKGFQRDQNLQLHRRGHNLPWKLRQRGASDPGVVVAAAAAGGGAPPRKRVYVCPEPTCVHHDPARALGDLTGIKKHFSRKHGEKRWRCERCGKRYAVHSDWKAHVKNCGTREYRCDCGILFSRKDSLLTHRAFCDALAEESARLLAAAANNSSSITTCNINGSSSSNTNNLLISSSSNNTNNLLISNSSSSSSPLFLPFSSPPDHAAAAENPNPNQLLFLQQHHLLHPQFQAVLQRPPSPPVAAAYFDHLLPFGAGAVTGSKDNSSVAAGDVVVADAVSFGLTSEGSVTMHAGGGGRLTRDFLGVDHDGGEVEELELELPLSAADCQGYSFATTAAAVSRAACCATDFTTSSRQYLGRRLPPVNETWSHNF